MKPTCFLILILLYVNFPVVTALTCLSGTGVQSGSCWLCGPGFQSPGGLDVYCTVCPGTTISSPTGIGGNTCESCPFNSICVDGIATSIVLICPAGEIDMLGSCTPCPVDTYSDAGATFCLACPLLDTCVNGLIVGAGCPAGQFEAMIGVCTVCPAGMYSDAGAIACLICPLLDTCVDGLIVVAGCNAGSYDSLGLCLSCPIDTYSDAGATECLPCPLLDTCVNGLLVVATPAPPATPAPTPAPVGK